MYEFTRSSSCFSAKFLKNNLRTPYFFRSTNNRGETTFISYEYRSKRDGMEGGRERLMEKTLKHVAHLTKRILFYWNVWKEENLRNESLRGIKDAHTFLGEHFSGTGDPTILPMN